MKRPLVMTARTPGSYKNLYTFVGRYLQKPIRAIVASRK